MENVLSTYDDEDEIAFIVCDVCNVKIRTDALYRIHLTTAQHLKREEALIATGKARRQPPLPKWTSYTDYLDYLQIDEPIVGLKHLVEVATLPGSLGPRYLCKPCRYEGDMPDMTNHIIGRKHRQKYLEMRRPDLVTWDKITSFQQGKVVRAKAEVAERQDGRGAPERLKKKPGATGKIGALKVPNMQWRGKQPLAQGPGGVHHRPPQHKDGPSAWGPLREESYGWGYPEPHLPQSFAPGEEWRAEQPRRRSLEKEGRFYPHGHAHKLPVDSYPLHHYGDPERAGEGERGGAYADEARRGGAYADEARRGGAYADEARRGGAYGYDERTGEGGRGMGFEGERRGEAISQVESGRGERLSHRNAGSSAQDVEEAKWPPASEAPNAVNKLPETFKRFLSGAVDKLRVRQFSQDAELSREMGSKKLKLDHLNQSSGQKNFDIESVEEANFIKDKLCNLLKEFQATKSQRERAMRKSSSGVYRDYNHLSSQQLGPSVAPSHGTDPFLLPPGHYEEDQRDPQDHYERGQRYLQDHYKVDQRDPQDHYERGLRDPQDHYERGQRDLQDHYERGQRDPQDRYESSHRDPQDHYEKGPRDQQDHYERGQRDPQDRYESSHRDPQDHYEKGPRDPQDHYERGPRDPQDQYERGNGRPQDHFERGSRDSKDCFERGQRDPQGRYEEYGRGQEDHYDPVPRQSREKSEKARVDPRVAHRHSYEDVFDPRRLPAPPQQGYSIPENSASLEKLTSTLLQLVAHKRRF
ncbi:uncharacterized protein LOC133120044 [Conger conger]|uniref:uncharacterized protein LOC133120044 n=1 Tax=Conger conger TaxID=82655 RepID=UPI002A5A82EE|nr:uncharacterized protein LOC133120044 [Conger conger]